MRYTESSQGLSRAEHKIELIREYRNWLISDIVTDKVNVRSIEVLEIPGEELLALYEYNTDESRMIDEAAMEIEG